jgi:hypothetical protein
VEDEPGQNVLVGMSDLRLVAGWEAYTSGGKEWRAQLGYVFARDLSIQETSIFEPSDALLVEVSCGF